MKYKVQDLNIYKILPLWKSFKWKFVFDLAKNFLFLTSIINLVE